MAPLRLATALLATHRALGYNNGVGATPPMGWNSWCTDSLCNAAGLDPCSEKMVRSVADAFVSEGLKDAGYEYINLDDCWSAKTRDADGNLQPEPRMFPNGIRLCGKGLLDARRGSIRTGMKAVADYVHSKGLKLGLYTCAGTMTCKGLPPCATKPLDARRGTAFRFEFWTRRPPAGLLGQLRAGRADAGGLGRRLREDGPLRRAA
jgi:alpha-galactosidase